MDSTAYAAAPTTVAPAQALFGFSMSAQHAQMTANDAARIKGQVSLAPISTVPGAWSPPPRREPL